MNEKLIGHGFIPPLEIKPEEYIFGQQKLPDKILQDRGDWRDFLPAEEQQRKSFDTYGCTIYNTISPIEILERRLFGEDSEYAERPVYIGTGTRPPGNNPHIIAEWIRNNGLVPDEMLSFSDDLQNLDEYASPDPLSMDIIQEGKRWLDIKTFGHEWAFLSDDPKTKNDILKEVLRRSPLAVSVVGWREINNIYYKDRGEPDNHWAVLIVYEDRYPIIFDSYYPFIKKLDRNYDFGYAKRYSVDKKQILTGNENIIENHKVVSWWKRLWRNWFDEVMKIT